MPLSKGVRDAGKWWEAGHRAGLRTVILEDKDPGARRKATFYAKESRKLLRCRGPFLHDVYLQGVARKYVNQLSHLHQSS